MQSMQRLALSCAVFLPLGVATAAGQAPTVAPEGLPCEPVGEIRFICDLISPEDLAVVPGSEWVIASGNRPGGRIHLVSVRDKTATELFPGDAPSERLDAATYPTCPGPIDPDEGDEFTAHGLYLKPGPDAVHTLYVVHHGRRESVEVFEVDARARPRLTWIGCAVRPRVDALQRRGGAPRRRFRRHEPRDGRCLGVADRRRLDAGAGAARTRRRTAWRSPRTDAGCISPAGPRRS